MKEPGKISKLDFKKFFFFDEGKKSFFIIYYIIFCNIKLKYKLNKFTECLIISSDEEHENEKSAKLDKSGHQTYMETEEGMNSEDLGIILKKEPVITNQSATTSEGIEGSIISISSQISHSNLHYFKFL